MIKSLFRLLLLLLSLSNPGLLRGQATQAGIHFQPGDFQQALAQAKAAHKLLFVEIYLTGCPHCEALAPMLKEKAVGDFYNARFVSWQVEANSPASKALQKARSIAYPEFPLLLFFDTDGQLVHLATPAEQASPAAYVEEVLRIGRTALDPGQRLSSYARRFERVNVILPC